MEIGLSLGANLGDRLANLQAARTHILKYPGVDMVAQSPVYETEPVDVPAEYREVFFLNAILIIKSEVPAPQLLQLFYYFEQLLGRSESDVPNTPRPIDIDIIYAGDLIIDERNLTIPHPRWTTRRFVLQPLADLRPDLRLPGHTDSVSEILAGLKTSEQVNLFVKVW